MSTTTEAPRLPKLPFILADVVLLGVAGFIAYSSPLPMGGSALIAVVVLVALGAVALAIPFISDYGRKTDALLTERQDQIAALAQTTTTSAEQLSIAVASLHSINETASRSAKLLEGLPHKLHEKVSELKAQLNEVAVTGNDALEQEVQTLRSAESDRLVSAIDQLATTAKELNRLEAQSSAHAKRVSDAFATLPQVAEQAAARAVEGVNQGVTASRRELEALVTQHRNALTTASALAQTQTSEALETHLARASAELDSAFSTFLGRLVAQTESANRAMDDKLTILSAASIRLERQLAETASTPSPPARKPRTPRTPAASAEAPDTSASPLIATSTPAEAGVQTATETGAENPRGDNSHTEVPSPEPPATVIVDFPGKPDAAHGNLSPSATVTIAPPPPLETPAKPVFASSAGSPPPMIEATAESFAIEDDNVVEADEPEEPASRRIAAPKGATASRAPSPVTDELFPVDEPGQFDDEEPDGDDASSAALTADGATRLLVTAYIGIGNKLFLRGNGAGLTWEKGVPLQFVSIGKWRWETNDATLPMSARLYKNDQIECIAIGTFTLEPGRQRELTATF